MNREESSEDESPMAYAAAAYPQVKLLQFEPMSPINRDQEYLAQMREQGVTIVEQIARLDIELRGKVYRDCAFIRGLTCPRGHEVMGVYGIEIEGASDDDRFAVASFAGMACLEADHDPPRPWK